MNETTHSEEAVGAVRQDENRRNANKAAVASWVGSTLEYFDFFIYGSASALIFNQLFFPAAGPYLGAVLSMATLSVGYIVRPVAALIIGHFGDRIGRKQMLILTVVSMGVATFLIGCLPTAESIGVLAPILLVLLRAVQGASAAGESVGATTMALEHAPKNRRGFYGSWTNTGAVAGIMLGSLAFIGVQSMPDEIMMSWGWRIPFWLGLVVAGVGIVVRTSLPESEVFEDEKSEKAAIKRELPIKQVVSSHLGSVVAAIGIALVTVISSIVSAFGLNYASTQGSIETSAVLWMTIVTAAIGIGTQPLCGLLSDFIGRKPVFILGCVICSGTMFGIFASIASGNTVGFFVWGILTMSIGYAMVNPLLPAIIAEMFPTHIRYSGAAIASQLGLIVTGFAPTIAAVVVRPGDWGWLPVAIFSGACCLLAALVTALFVKETYRTETHALGNRSDEA